MEKKTKHRWQDHGTSVLKCNFPPRWQVVHDIRWPWVNQRQWRKECELKLKIKNMPNLKKKKPFISQQSFCACIRHILQNCSSHIQITWRAQTVTWHGTISVDRGGDWDIFQQYKSSFKQQRNAAVYWDLWGREASGSCGKYYTSKHRTVWKQGYLMKKRNLCKTS